MYASEEEHITEEKPPRREGFSDTNSVRGAASLSPREMGKAIGRKDGVSRKETNMLNAASRDTRLESLQLKIRDLVGQLGLEQRVREATQAKAEEMAGRFRGSGELSETDVALAAVIRVVREYGWSFQKIVEKLAKADRRIAAVDDLRVGVLLGRRSKTVTVRVGGEERRFEALKNGTGATRLLRIQAFATDNGKLLELKGAAICTQLEKGSGGRRLLCPTDSRLDIIKEDKATVRIGSSFEALKLLKRVELDSENGGRTTPTIFDEEAARNDRVSMLLRRFRTEKLPLTEYLLAETGVLMRFRTRYADLFRSKFDPQKVRERLRKANEDEVLLRSPRLLAREALEEADRELFDSLPETARTTVRRLASERGLPGDVRGFVVWSELKAWEE